MMQPGATYLLGEDSGTAVASPFDHAEQLAALNRCKVKINVQTPWGAALLSEIYADGVVFHATAFRGGFHLSAEWNALIQPSWRNADGWYDGDFEWVKVVATFPALFTDLERRGAREAFCVDP